MDYHLTPRGWETGPRPADAIETARVLERLPFGSFRFTTIWQNEKTSSEERERLYKLHTPVPHH